jgi:hypothetical protein
MEQNSDTVGIGFLVDRSLSALFSLEKGKKPDEGRLKALRRLSGVLETLFVKEAIDVVEESPDFLSICLYPWVKEASQWVEQRAADLDLSKKQYVKHLCAVIQELLSARTNATSEEDLEELKALLEKLQSLTLQGVNRVF